MTAQMIRTVLDEELAALLPDAVDLWPLVSSKWAGRRRHEPDDKRKEPSPRLRPRPSMRRLAWAALAIIILAGVIFAVPRWRTAAADRLSDLWRVLTLSGDADGPAHFAEEPPFTIFQPARLPDGFVLRIAQGHSGGTPAGENGLSLTSEIVRQDGVDAPPSPAIDERVAVYQSDHPHALFVYQLDAETYLLLHERAAQPGETLPPGSARRVGDQPATLQQIDNALQLTWERSGTWLTLEGTVAEATLLEVARSLEETRPDDPAGGNEVTGTAAGALPLDLPFCDPADEPPQGPLLGELAGQPHQGDIRLSFVGDERQPAGTAYSLNQPGSYDDLLRRAIAALQAPDLALEALPYPSLGQYASSTEEPCLRPDPGVRGYIVIEVWESQVNVGYGGAGDQYIDRAIEALEQELAGN